MLAKSIFSTFNLDYDTANNLFVTNSVINKFMIMIKFKVKSHLV